MDALHYIMARLKTAQIVHEERGIAALEYALIAALIGIAISVGVKSFGTSLNSYFGSLGTSVGSMSTSVGK